MSHQVKTNGWCGTTNDRAVYAHGEYGTLDEAIGAIKEVFGEFRTHDQYGEPFDEMDADIVFLCKPGRYIKMKMVESCEVLNEALYHYGISEEHPASSDVISNLLLECEYCANIEGVTLHPDSRDYLERFSK